MYAGSEVPKAFNLKSMQEAMEKDRPVLRGRDRSTPKIGRKGTPHRRILSDRSYKKDGRLYELHATRGWRSTSLTKFG